jgi:hypothetical protein
VLGGEVVGDAVEPLLLAVVVPVLCGLAWTRAGTGRRDVVFLRLRRAVGDLRAVVLL